MEESVADPCSVNSSKNKQVSDKNEPQEGSLSTEDAKETTESGKEQQKSKGTKRKSSCETQLYTCEVCQVKLNSASQAYQHFQGKSHQGKVKMLEMAAEVKAPPVVSHPVTINTPVPQTTHIAPSSIEYYCSLCKKIFNSQTQADQHFSGKAHRHKISEDAISKSSPYSSSTKMGNGSTLSLDGQTAGFKNEAAQPKQPDINLGSNVKCQLFTCENCHITLNSPRQFQQHVSGLRHKIIVGKAKPPPPPQAEEPGWQEIRYKKLTTAMTTVGIMKNLQNTGANINTGGTQLGQYYCKDCDISVNSPLQLQQHMTSAKHKARLDGIAKGIALPARKKTKGRGGVIPGTTKPFIPGNIKAGNAAGRGRSTPSLSSSFVKAGKISTFYTTQTVEAPVTVQPSYNTVKSSFPVNGAIGDHYNSYSQHQYQMHLPPYSSQMY
ncbi:zinc finger protein 385D-like [Actinia tenebrosa]|uniref:Zinc finger protein 385D-like n=1 Tax=Actinia tenebrosa TaxID=6105 RepID=A0A6P8IKN1_ACTTE|nr:zinc finger protein 385D-like [Actinia tenebrosa]